MRITIVGFSGSGKTMLARRISETFAIPHLQLDRLWFEAGGHKARTNEDKERVREIIKEHVAGFITKPDWVSDGFYKRVQPMIAAHADMIIFLDVSLLRRICNHLTRVLLKDNRHPELTVVEDLMHIFTIIRRTFTCRKDVKDFLKNHEVAVLRSREEIDNFIHSLKR